jgi:phage-related minor tail protein
MNEVVVPVEVKQTIETRVAWAKTLVIRTPAERDSAIAIVKEVKGLIRAVESSFDATVKAAHATWKAAVAHRDSFLTGPAEVERLAKAAIVKYDREEEEKRLNEQRRLQAIEDEKRRKEQERLDALARAQREKEEAARRAEEEARQRAAQAENEEARKRALADAEKAKKAADAAAAKALQREEASAYLPPAAAVTVQPVAAKTEGESKAVVWKARVLDAQAFIQAAVAAGRFEFILVDEKALNDFARRTKGQVKLTGVEFFNETRMSVRI